MLDCEPGARLLVQERCELGHATEGFRIDIHKRNGAALQRFSKKHIPEHRQAKRHAARANEHNLRRIWHFAPQWPGTAGPDISKLHHALTRAVATSQPGNVEATQRTYFAGGVSLGERPGGEYFLGHFTVVGDVERYRSGALAGLAALARYSSKICALANAQRRQPRQLLGVNLLIWHIMLVPERVENCHFVWLTGLAQ
jgi:hypothetical protein